MTKMDVGRKMYSTKLQPNEKRKMIHLQLFNRNHFGFILFWTISVSTSATHHMRCYEYTLRTSCPGRSLLSRSILWMIHPWSPILLPPNFQKRKIPSPGVVMGTIMKYQVWKRYGHCIRRFGIQKIRKRRRKGGCHEMNMKERERVWIHHSLHFIPWYFLPKFEFPSMSMCYIYIHPSYERLTCGRT